MSTLNQDSEVLNVFAISSKLEAPTFALPCWSSLRHFVGFALAALDLDGLCGLVGVVGIPILAGFGAPAKELFDVFNSCAGVYFYLGAAGACEGLSRCRGIPDCGRPRKDVPIIRSSLETHTL